MRVLWGLTALSAVLAGLVATVGLMLVPGALAPLVAGAALAMAVVPYVFTRALEELGRRRPGELPASGYWFCPECAEPVRINAKICPHCHTRPAPLGGGGG